VNIVTKRPNEFFKGEISTTIGNNQFLRTTVDINSPLNKEKTALFRVNAAWNEESSFKNYGFNKSINIAPSFLYHVNDRLTFNADLEIYKVKQTRSTYTNFTPASGFNSIAQVPLAFDQTVFADDAYAEVTAVRSFAEARYRMSNNWTSTTGIAYVKEDVAFSYQNYLKWLSPTRAEGSNGIWGPIPIQYTNIQQNFTGQFNTRLN
jgi:iron complex outermembrane receptor protein